MSQDSVVSAFHLHQSRRILELREELLDVLQENRLLRANLTSTQQRCTELLLELRNVKRRMMP